MSILNKKDYIINTPYIISAFIREYDIRKANINILYRYGVLSKEQYEYYLKADRFTRQRDIGLMQRDHKVDKILSQGIMKAKQDFFSSNNITEDDILAIKNDAVFIMNKIPSVTKFDNIEFVLKNTYTSFYKIGRLEFFYFLDTINNIEKLDIKGIGDDKLILHENYFLEFLKVVFASAQTESIKDTLDIIITFYNNYINRELDIGYYRSFDSESVYYVKSDLSDYHTYKAHFLEEHNKTDIDINHVNLKIIMELYKYYSSINFYGGGKF